MKLRVPKYFKDFKCIADKCEDTCCAGWLIVIDDEMYQRYQNVKGEFGERLRGQIVSQDEENVFTLKNNNCPFLNESNLCDIYKELGKDYLCHTCRLFPRYIEEFGVLREKGISLSCPEGARLILNHTNKTEFEVTEIDETFETLNEIDEILLTELVEARNVMFDILQDRTLAINIRAALILHFANEIQECIDADEISNIKNIRYNYLNKEYIDSTLSKFIRFKNKPNDKYNNMLEYINEFKELKHINNDDPLKLENAINCFFKKDNIDFYMQRHFKFNELFNIKSYKFENILVYYIFRYLMTAVFDYDVLAKVQLAIISYLMIKELSVVKYTEKGKFDDADLVSITHMYSKDIEHLEENVYELQDIFKMNSKFHVDEMLVSLLN